MVGTRILVLDLAPSTPLAEDLPPILEGSDERPLELVRESVGAAGLTDRDLASLARSHGVQAVFLVLPSHPLDACRDLLAGDRPSVPVFAATASEDPAELFELLELGVTDFVRPPLRACEILPRLWRCLDHWHPQRDLNRRIEERSTLQRLVGRNPAFTAEVEKIPLLARCDVGVLICGETGTGKELVARAVHYLSPRAGAAFVPVNCGAMPVELAENELFGHERGAFTGATDRRAGLVEEADGGTLLLDEVDSLPLATQVKLLRFLQDKEFRRLGSTRMRSSDARIIAATNSKVEEAVEQGRLRRDLYYRLNVVPIRLPPLRERREDVGRLARHFLDRDAGKLGRQVSGFSDSAREALIQHDWPGNVRELEHVVQRALVLSRDRSLIRQRDLLLPAAQARSDVRSFREAKARVIDRFERKYLEEMLAIYRGNITHAAQAAGKNRRAFWELLRKHGIDARRFRPAAPKNREAPRGP